MIHVELIFIISILLYALYLDHWRGSSEDFGKAMDPIKRKILKPFASSPKKKAPKVNDDTQAWKVENEIP